MKKLIFCGISMIIFLIIFVACVYDMEGIEGGIGMFNCPCANEWGVLYPFEENGLWGYMDVYGNVVIEPQYRSALRFSEGLALVQGVSGREYQTGYIDLEGNLVIPIPAILSTGWFSCGFAAVILREWDRDNERPLAVGRKRQI